MLHGSIKSPDDPNMGLILTQNDLRRAQSTRTAFYRRLSEDMQTGEVVYVGFSLSDNDFRQVVGEIRDSVGALVELVPRGYAVIPNPFTFAQKYWDGQKVTLIDATLEEFAGALASFRKGHARSQPIAVGATPLMPSFLKDVNPASEEAQEISSSFEFPEQDDGSPEPHLFLRGGPASWATIRDRFDAIRDCNDDLVDALLVNATDEPSKPSPSCTKFVLLTGHAGSGKSTLGKRVAWDLANSWAQPVAWVRHPSRLQFDIVEALASKAKRRVYVFVDNAADSAPQVVNVIGRCKRRGIRVSFLLIERENEWTSASDQHPIDPDRLFRLDRLTNGEATGVVDRLTRADELNSLLGLSVEEQIRRLVDRSGRQLLVAMREVTEDRNFDEIIMNEYESLPTESARRAYLVVCSLFQFGVGTRAGVMSRTTGVPFESFRDSILVPAKDVIVEIQDSPWQQPTYTARHRVIADVVFRRAFPTSAQRSVQIQSLLQNLDPGYREDSRAFSRLVNARWLRDRMVEDADQEQIYELAGRLRQSDGHVVQQHALAWRFRDRVKADRLLTEAASLAPDSDAIKHSRAMLLFDDARAARGYERSQLLAKAESAFHQLMKKEPNNSAPYVSLVDATLLRVQDAEDPAERIALLASARRVLQEGFKNASISSYLLDTAGRVDEVSGRLQDAEDDYHRAAKAAGPDPHVWTTYVRFLENHRGLDAAKVALNEALDQNPIDPRLNHELARILGLLRPQDEEPIRSAYRLAMAERIEGHLAELDFAIYLHERGHIDEANAHFQALRSSDLPSWVKNRPRQWVTADGKKTTFSGEIADIRLGRAYLRVAEYPSTVFVRLYDLPTESRRVGARVEVTLFYNCHGLTACPLEPSSRMKSLDPDDDLGKPEV